MHRFLAIFASAILLAACTGGSGASGGAAPAIAIPAPVGQANIRLLIPASSSSSGLRHRNYLGSNVLGVTIAVGVQGGTPTTTAFDVSPGSSLCTTTPAGRSCTLVVSAPMANDQFTIQTWDTAPLNGAIPSSAHLVGSVTQQNVPFTGTTTLTFTIGAEIGSIGLSTTIVSFGADGHTHTSGVVIAPADFSNARSPPEIRRTPIRLRQP